MFDAIEGNFMYTWRTQQIIGDRYLETKQTTEAVSNSQGKRKLNKKEN